MIYNGRYAYHTHSDLNHYQENAKSFFLGYSGFQKSYLCLVCKVAVVATCCIVQDIHGIVGLLV